MAHKSLNWACWWHSINRHSKDQRETDETVFAATKVLQRHTIDPNQEPYWCVSDQLGDRRDVWIHSQLAKAILWNGIEKTDLNDRRKRFLTHKLGEYCYLQPMEAWRGMRNQLTISAMDRIDSPVISASWHLQGRKLYTHYELKRNVKLSGKLHKNMFHSEKLKAHIVSVNSLLNEEEPNDVLY